MATRPGERPGLSDAARAVAEHANEIVKLELALAQLEVQQKAKRLGIGAGLFAAAAFLGLIAILLVIAAITAAIALALPVWAAILVVLAGVVLVIAILALLGRKMIKRGAPPVPEQAIEEARLTTEMLRNGHH
ncbi:MAG TPA: phage holin family protein [Gaiellaceae bacterium]